MSLNDNIISGKENTMKKTLSIIMALCMVLSVCFFSVTAVESNVGSVAGDYKPAEGAIAITDAAGFAAMAADGNYYLENDITIDASYASVFTGTFDGNGKTVTVSAPMFTDVAGTVKNLVINGAIAYAGPDALTEADLYASAMGAVAKIVTSGSEIVFENIKNNATVSSCIETFADVDGDGVYNKDKGDIPFDECVGSIVGKVENEAGNVKFINCENNATITGNNQLGGIAGWIKSAASVLYDTCINKGEVKNNVDNAYSGGIVCRSDAYLNTYKNCENYANVVSGKDQAGGILAYSSKGSTVIDNCVNYADLTSTAGLAAGIAANINCSDVDGELGYYISVTNCVNYGKINSADVASGIVGKTQKNHNSVISKCVNYADLTGVSNSGGIVGHTTQSFLEVTYCENRGNVTVTGGQYAGGICGYAWGTKSSTISAANGDIVNKIEFCINSGDIIADTRAGGICSSYGTSNSLGIWVTNYCINTGNVTSLGKKDNNSGNCAGGVVGYAYASGNKAHAIVTNCITTGNVDQQNATVGQSAYFLAYTNSKNELTYVNNNTALGTLTSASGDVFSIGWNNKYNFKEAVGNSLPAGCTYPAAYESQAVSTRTFEFGTTDEAALKSGATVYALNQAYKAATGSTEDLVYMALDGTFAPTFVAEVDNSGIILNAVVPNADGTFSNPEPAPETTEPAPETTEPAPETTEPAPETTEPAPETTEPAPETTEPAPETTEPGSSTPTGDSALIFAVIAVISVLGVAVVAKKREN